jgi:hypothetical protein
MPPHSHRTKSARHKHKKHRHSSKRKGGHCHRSRSDKNENVECQLVSLFSARVLATREMMVRILKSGTERKDEILVLAQQLRKIHSDIAGVFVAKQTEAYPAATLAMLMNSHTDTELSLFNAIHQCFQESKGSICPSVKQASDELDASSKKIASFLFQFHPSLMDSFAGDIAKIRQEYYDRLFEHIHAWVNTTKEMAMAYMDGRLMDSSTITCKLIEVSKNMALVWAKIAVQFVPPSLLN